MTIRAKPCDKRTTVGREGVVASRRLLIANEPATLPTLAMLDDDVGDPMPTSSSARTFSHTHTHTCSSANRSFVMTSGLRLPFALVDVFTQTRYAGNPLAIVHVPKSCTLSQGRKQDIAQEFNLSETTFLHEREAGSDSSEPEWVVDIFTTHEELPFAGHPTIGTACFVLSGLLSERKTEGDIRASFKLKAGPIQLQYNAASNTAKATIPHNV